MKRVHGNAWLPDDETDRVMLGCGVQYQSNKLQPALKYCKHARTALDVGAHCGLWTVQLAQYFERVEAFEPLQRHIECWRRNAGWKGTNRLHEVALGEQHGTCGLQVVETMSGKSHVQGDGATPVRRLDDFGFTDVDLIKIDVEGYELFVVKGGEETLTRWKPVVIVEQKPTLGKKYGLHDTAAIEYLKGLGAVVREEIVGDYILTWE
jgi:FkbM family methyltransferase